MYILTKIEIRFEYSYLLLKAAHSTLGVEVKYSNVSSYFVGTILYPFDNNHDIDTSADQPQVTISVKLCPTLTPTTFNDNRGHIE